MEIFGIGIDIVELKRINRLYSLYGDKFAKKILNDDNFKKNKFIDLRIPNQIIVK